MNNAAAGFEARRGNVRNDYAHSDARRRVFPVAATVPEKIRAARAIRMYGRKCRVVPLIYIRIFCRRAGANTETRESVEFSEKEREARAMRAVSSFYFPVRAN